MKAKCLAPGVVDVMQYNNRLARRVDQVDPEMERRVVSMTLVGTCVYLACDDLAAGVDAHDRTERRGVHIDAIADQIDLELIIAVAIVLTEPARSPQIDIVVVVIIRSGCPVRRRLPSQFLAAGHVAKSPLPFLR